MGDATALVSDDSFQFSQKTGDENIIDTAPLGLWRTANNIENEV
jgi:hypothetical protein